MSEVESVPGSAGVVIVERQEDVSIIRLGAPEERAVLLDATRLNSLKQALAEIREQKKLLGLVITGAHARQFCAGADIKIIGSVTDADSGRELARQGQEVFDLLDDMPCTTVAAINGACVGGGCELVLACDYRISLDDSKTQIGLPEIKLGIIPGFGGTQRLPRLVGIRAALDVILKGKTLGVSDALRIGLIDEVVAINAQEIDQAWGRLEKRAIGIAQGLEVPERKALSLMEKLLTFTAVGRATVSSKIKPNLATKAKHYPAPPRALEVTCVGLGRGLKAGLAAEADAIGELMCTPVSKALVHVFFQRERAGKLGKSVKGEISDLTVGVVGSGRMGAGIASSFLSAGYQVSLVDVDPAVLDRGKDAINKSLEKNRRLNPQEKEKALNSLSTSTKLEALKPCSFVVEAVFEDFDVKQEVLGKVCQAVADDTVIASNTSSLPITILAGAVTNPGRFLGMHFFNPAEKMPLVEVVMGESSSSRSIVTTAALASALGKFPVAVRDVPGFLVNRVLSAYFVEATSLFAEGVPIDVIDQTALDFGMPMGPFRLLDEIGLDVAAKVAAIMVESYGPRMSSPNFAERLAAMGRLGRRSGRGFYIYQDGTETADGDLGDALGVRWSTAKTVFQDVEDRLFLAMGNEAVRCLDEGVAGFTGEEAAGQVDLATVMGMGFAPFRGGLVHYLESRGAPEVNERLMGLMRSYGERLSPVTGIRVRAELASSFYLPLPEKINS